MKKILLFLIGIAVLAVCFCAAFSARFYFTGNECDHNYYRSDYVEASVGKEGYEEYTCSECGKTYTEVIPALKSSEIEQPESGSGEPEQEEEKAEEEDTQVNLLDLPFYSTSEDYNDPFEYETDIQDLDGWRHKDCYSVLCTYDEGIDACFTRWELDGAYNTLCGTICLRDKSVNWLEFYDGNDLIYTTDKISEENTSTSFEIDVRDVEYLTMYCYSDQVSWIIADDIILTKSE